MYSKLAVNLSCDIVLVIVFIVVLLYVFLDSFFVIIQNLLLFKLFIKTKGCCYYCSHFLFFIHSCNFIQKYISNSNPLIIMLPLQFCVFFSYSLLLDVENVTRYTMQQLHCLFQLYIYVQNYYVLHLNNDIV